MNNTNYNNGKKKKHRLSKQQQAQIVRAVMMGAAVLYFLISTRIVHRRIFRRGAGGLGSNVDNKKGLPQRESQLEELVTLEALAAGSGDAALGKKSFRRQNSTTVASKISSTTLTSNNNSDTTTLKIDQNINEVQEAEDK